MKRRRWLFLAVALVALLLLGDAGLWFAAQQALARGFAAWAADMAAQGLVVTAGPASAGGFPFTATRSFPVSLQAGEAVLRSERVTLVLSPRNPHTVRVLLPTPVAVAAPSLPPLALNSPDWHLDAALDGSDISTDAKTLDIAIAGPNGDTRHVRVALAHLQVVPAGAVLDVAGSAQSIVLPEPLPGEVWPLGRHLASLAFQAGLHGRLPPPSASRSWLSPAVLSAWRDSGGAIDLRRLAIGYGPLGLAGNAHLALDSGLQPMGTASLRVLGYAETLDALVAAHVVTAHAARAAGAVLALLARAPEGGGAPEVPLDVTLRDRVLTVAGFPLAKLPSLAVNS